MGLRPAQKTRVYLMAGAMLAAALIWQGTRAAFTADTRNPGNSFAAGTVTLTDDDAGSAMFSVSGLKPGSSGSRCITVTYAGSLAATVKMFVAPGGLVNSGLAAYLNLTVEEGSGGSYASCAGFSSSATIYSGTLAGFASASTDSATGVGGFAPVAAAETASYRVTYTLADNNLAQGTSAQVAFTWEASST